MSDKRSVHTDALATLGTIIDNTAARDAIHLAVEPVIAGERLLPGQHIGVVGTLASTKAPKKLGIVDPFINGIVEPGQMFWLIVFPRTISSLRHVWSHPDFEEQAPTTEVEQNIKFHKLTAKEESEKWLKGFCDNNDCPSYYYLLEQLMDDDISPYNNEYFHIGGRDASGAIPDIFWDHAEIVTGKKFDTRPKYFSCSC